MGRVEVMLYCAGFLPCHHVHRILTD